MKKNSMNNDNIFGMNVEDLTGYQIVENKREVETITTVPISEHSEELEEFASNFFDFIGSEIFALAEKHLMSLNQVYNVLRILSEEIILNMFYIRTVEFHNLKHTGTAFIPSDTPWQNIESNEFDEKEQKYLETVRSLILGAWQKDKLSFLTVADILRQHEKNVIENLVNKLMECVDITVNKNQELKNTIRRLKRQIKNINKDKEE